MNVSRRTARALAAWRWAADHRTTWGFLAFVIWTAVIYPFVGYLPVALLCGAAFGVVSAATLPAPPSDS